MIGTAVTRRHSILAVSGTCSRRPIIWQWRVNDVMVT